MLRHFSKFVSLHRWPGRALLGLLLVCLVSLVGAVPGRVSGNQGAMYLLQAVFHGKEGSALKSVQSFESNYVIKTPHVRAYLGWAYYLSGDESNALSWWQTAPSESEDLLSYQGDKLLKYAYGDPFFVFNYLPRPTEETLRKAEQFYALALKFAPHSSSLLYRLALVNQMTERPVEAEEYYRMAVEENSFKPQDGQTALLQSYFYLGAFAWDKGDKALACQNMAKILELSPGHSNARTVYYGGWGCG